jgi:GPI mannosyltransferase 3
MRRVTPDITAGAAVFAVAFAARLLPVFVFPGINHPDEVFQTVEQAHRLVFGNGLVPWEFVYGTRSWVLPGMLAGLMMLASQFCDGPSCYVPIIGSALAALGAANALCSFLWGRRFFGTVGGVVAGSFAAVWIDAVYFGPRALSDAVAAHVLVIGLYASTPGQPNAATWQRAAGAGALLSLAASLRVQLLPALALTGLWGIFTTLRNQRLAFVGSGLFIGLLYGAVDGFTWGYPFESLWRNVTANVYYGVQAVFGISPWYWYLPTVLEYWTGLAGAMSALCLIGALRLPLPFVAAGMIVLTYSLFAHKEFRFIYPAVLLAVTISGVGLAQLVSWIGEALRDRGWPRRHAVIAPSATALAVVVLTELALANGSEPYQKLWTRGRDMILASRDIARLGAVCGIGVLDLYWANTGGYTSFHHAVPLYWATPAGPLDPDSSAFNTVVYDRRKPVGAGYVAQACFGDSCVAQRLGDLLTRANDEYVRPAASARFLAGRARALRSIRSVARNSTCSFLPKSGPIRNRVRIT